MSIVDSFKHLSLAARQSNAEVNKKALEQKFQPFTEMTKFNMKINEAYALLGSIFAHEAFFSGGGLNRFESYNKQSNAKEITDKAIEYSRFDNKIAESGDHIVFSLKMPDLRCYVAGLRAQPTSIQASQRELALSILSSMFPELKVDELPLSRGHVLAAIPERKITIEQIASIKIDGISALNINDWPKIYRGLVSFVLQPYDLMSRSSATDHMSPHMELTMQIGVKAIIKAPKEYARFAINAVGDSLNLVGFYQFFVKRYKFFNTGKVRGKPDDKMGFDPTHIDRIEKYLTEAYGINERPQVNDEGICSLPDGRLIWVAPPTKVNIDGMFNSCLEDADEQGFRNINTEALNSRHVYTSWQTNKMIVTDANGEFQIVDLNGARIPSHAALAHLMSQSIGEHIVGISAIANRVEFPLNLHLLQAANIFIDDIKEGYGTWENLIDVPLSSEDTVEAKFKNNAFFDLGSQITQVYNRVLSANIPVYEQYEIRGYLALVAVYGKSRMEFAKRLSEQSALNRASIKSDKVPPLHDLKGVDGLMPHQVRVTNELANTEITNSLLDISAGGGKSLSMLFDITNLMKAGKIKRPLILMPRNLLGQFAREIIKFTKGNLRPFILSTATWRSMEQAGYHPNKAMYNDKLDAELHSIAKILRNLKKNTVLLADYNWLQRDWREIEVYGSTAKIYPHAMLLDRIGVDYVAADESQRIKKLTAGRTKAAAVTFANAKFRRLSSGTLLHNTVEDLIGQMAVIEPLALGDIGELMKQKATPKTAEARRQLETNITNFTRRVTVRRREWAHLLPTIRESVNPVKLTKRQQKYNDDLIRKALDSFEKDKKLAELKKTNLKAYEKRLEKLMKRSFQPMEVWLNAPDSQSSEISKTFGEMDGVTKDDLISAKVEMVDKIIDTHLHGGPATDGENENIPPDPNKILVLGYNVEVSKHIFKHSKYAHLGVHFTAGDDAAMAAFISEKEGSPKILFGDFGGMSEGFNLQIASRIIILQAPWTPGLMEQLVARIWRPDVPDPKTGEVKYPRDYVWINRVTCIPSIEVPKTARLISKQVDNLRYSEEENSKSLKETVESNPLIFQNLKTVKMNLDTIRKYAMESQETDTTALLDTAYTAYRLIKNWEDEEFKESRRRLDQEIFEKTGKKVTRKNRSRLSMVPVTSDETQEFVPANSLQSLGFAPWVDSYTGFNPTSLNLIPLSAKLEDSDDDEDDEEEDGETEELIQVVPGDPVMTQYGPGRVSRIRKGSSNVWVIIPGYSRQEISLKRVVVLAGKHPEDKAALNKILARAGKTGLPLLKLDPNSQELDAVDSTVPAVTVDEFRNASVPSTVHIPSKTPNKIDSIKPTVPVIRGRGGKIVTPTPEKMPRVFIPKHEEEEAPIVRGRGGKIIEQPVVRGRGGKIVEQPRGISRAPGIENDEMVKPRRGRPPLSQPPIKPKPSFVNPVSMRGKVKEKDLWKELDGQVKIINGVISLSVLDEEDDALNSILVQMGFFRIGKYASIQIRNPKGYSNLVSLLASKFLIPRPIKRELDNFSDIYAEKRQNIAFAKNKELTFHRLWLRDQTMRAKGKNEVHPWPVVVDKRVYVQINLETCPAAKAIKNITMPTGIGNKVAYKPELVIMTKTAREIKEIIKQLEAKHIRFSNKAQLMSELSPIR